MYLVVSLSALGTLFSIISGFLQGAVLFGLIFWFVYRNLN